MTYKVVIKDEDGTFTRRGYESFREARDACDAYSRVAMENMFTACIYGRVRYDLGTDTYDWENPGLNEEGAA